MVSPIEKLQKFFRLEAERSYDNRAVVGGLEKILPLWEKEAQSIKIDEATIQAVSTRLFEYHQLELSSRADAIRELTEILLITQKKQYGIGYSASPSLKEIDSDIPGKGQPQFTSQSKSSQSLKKSSRISVHHNRGTISTIGLNDPLTAIPGIGEKNAQKLSKLEINTLADLLSYYPRRYDDYSQLKPINKLQYGDELTVMASVQRISTRDVHERRIKITEAVVTDNTGFLRLTWFNQPYITSHLKPGTQIVISGKIDMYLGHLVMNNPEWELLEKEHLHTNRIVPVYPLTAHVTQRWLRRLMYKTVSTWVPQAIDYLPENIRLASSIMDLPTAILQIHFPDTTDQLNAARHRLAFDEIFLLQLGILRQRYNWQSVAAQVYKTTNEWIDQQVANLPFSLTSAQGRVLEEIRKDLASGRPMNRLLQGDVGSGKTVIAAMGIAMVTNHGAQAAFMAPTSILADQHYNNLMQLLSSIESSNNNHLRSDEICLLIGDKPESEKIKIRRGLQNGEIKLIIGTHALIEEPIEFNHLQIAIIDEQHRFGVSQRAALRSKGKNLHLLVMTATPIPRSLALTIYGDLDISVIDEIPVGRLPVETYVLYPAERERAYQLIRSQVEQGYQSYIIYPLVDKGDEDQRKSAVEEYNRLQIEVFPKFNIGLLHGRLKPEEKEKAMTSFRNKVYDILVTTSVIEVGIDVPNATIMLIEGANRFGLAQLHQFRGRVGRSQAKSYCLLIPETDDTIENERLSVMAETNDGFVLAERDLEQRGPGQFFGTRQSGYSELKLANLSDIQLIKKARRQAQSLFNHDPKLSDPNHYELIKMVDRFWDNGRGDIS